MAENTSFHVENIIIDPELQTREGIDHNHVADIAAAIKARVKIKRPRVMRIDDPEDVDHHGKHYALDQHRVLGYKLADRKEVPALGLVGTWAECRDLATSSNSEHTALKRSRQAKERAVQMCLEDHPDWTDGRIAKHVQVSNGMVAEWRPTVEKAANMPPEKRVGLDGKKRRAAKPSKKGKPPPSPDDPDRFQPILSAFSNVSRQVNEAMNDAGGEKLLAYLTYYKLVLHPGARTVIEGDNVTAEPKFKGFPILSYIVKAAAMAGRTLSAEELKAKIEKWKEDRESFTPQRR